MALLLPVLTYLRRVRGSELIFSRKKCERDLDRFGKQCSYVVHFYRHLRRPFPIYIFFLTLAWKSLTSRKLHVGHVLTKFEMPRIESIYGEIP